MSSADYNDSDDFCETLFEETHRLLSLLDKRNPNGEPRVTLEPTDESTASWLFARLIERQISVLEELVLGDDQEDDEVDDEALNADVLYGGDLGQQACSCSQGRKSRFLS